MAFLNLNISQLKIYEFRKMNEINLNPKLREELRDLRSLKSKLDTINKTLEKIEILKNECNKIIEKLNNY